MNLYLGIDPGNAGAFAVLVDDESESSAVIVDMPVQVHELKSRKSNGKPRCEREVDGSRLCASLTLHTIDGLRPQIEQGRITSASIFIAVEALPRRGPRPLDQRQVMNFGKVMGAVEAFSSMMPGIDVRRVEAMAVRKFFNLGGEDYEDRKDTAVEYVMKTWGRHDMIVTTPRKPRKDGSPSTGSPKVERMDGRADALLIASWLRSAVKREGG